MEMIPIAVGLAGVLIALFLIIWAIRNAGSAQDTIRSLSEREERLRHGFDESPAGLAYTAAGGQWLQFNRRFAETVGYTREELLRTSFRDLTHPEDRKVESALVRRLKADEIRHFTMEKRIQQKDGKYKYVHEMCGISRRGVTGESYLWVVEDSSNRTGDTSGREEPIMSVMQRFEDFGFVRMNPQGMILSWNRGAEKLLGFMRNEVIGKSHKVLYRDVDVWEDKHVDDLKNAAMKGQIAHEDWRVGKDGYIRWMKTYIASDRREGDLHGFFEVFMEPPPDTKVLEEQKRSYELLKRTSEEKLEENRRTVVSLRREAERREQTEESLRETLEQLKTTREQSLRELQIMAEAMKKEIARRKMTESMLAEANRELQSARSEFEERLVSIVQPLAEEVSSSPPEVEVEATPWVALLEGGGEQMLREASSGQWTGTLYSRWKSRQTQIFFKRGRIFSCSSNDPSRYLAQMLINLGFMNEDDRQRAVEFQQQTSLSLGRVLLILDLVSEREMAEVLRLKAEEEVIELCSLDHGEIAFVHGEVPTALQLVPLRLDVESLLPTPFEEIATREGGGVEIAGESGTSSVVVSVPETVSDSRVVAATHETVPSPDDAAEKAHFEEILREWDEGVTAGATLPDADAIADAGGVSDSVTDGSNAGVIPEIDEAGAQRVEEPAIQAENSDAVEAQPGEAEVKPEVAESAGSAIIGEPGHEAESDDTEEERSLEPEAEAESDDARPLFIASRTGKKPRKFHRSTCKSGRKIPAKSRVTFESAAEAEGEGYVACRNCTKA